MRFNLEGIYIYIAYMKSILYTSENFNARNSKIKRRYLFDITCKFNLIFVLYFSDFNHKVLSSTTRCLAKGKYPKGKACILNLFINKYTTSTVGRLHIAYHKLWLVLIHTFTVIHWITKLKTHTQSNCKCRPVILTKWISAYVSGFCWT